MTENETIYVLEMNRPFAYSELQEAIDTAINLLKENKQYRAIGTIEEFKALKEQNAELHCEFQSINATMDLFEKEIKVKVIDEFADSIKTELDRFGVVNLDTCVLYDFIDRKAERLKAGGENEN